MKKLTSKLLFTISGALVASHAVAQTAPATPEHTFTPKVSLYSEYEYRGISQTSEKPAAQFNFDYSHASGFYAGAFLTNISWLKDYKTIGAARKSASMELDLFLGGKVEVAKDVMLDLGYLRYEYPGMEPIAGAPKANTDELYIGLASGPLSAKLSYATSALFGVPNSKGSTFFEVNYAQEIAPKLTLTGHIGLQKVKGKQGAFDNDKELSYTVYKLGATYDLGDGWNVGGYFKNTNAKAANYTALNRDWSKPRLVAFVSKTF